MDQIDFGGETDRFVSEKSLCDSWNLRQSRVVHHCASLLGCFDHISVSIDLIAFRVALETHQSFQKEKSRDALEIRKPWQPASQDSGAASRKFLTRHRKIRTMERRNTTPSFSLIGRRQIAPPLTSAQLSSHRLSGLVPA